MNPESVPRAPASTSMPSPRNLDYAAGFLSYLVPGLGQFAQGRFSKSFVFFVGVYGLFFYGMALGQWHNVYFADTASRVPGRSKLGALAIDLYNRPQFVGQVWIGAAAWPAIYHYWNDPPANTVQHRQLAEEIDKLPWWKQFQFALPEEQINRLQRDGDKRWDLGWVYTVIAGVLNVLVILDALAGPAYLTDADREARPA
jgi:hypothetical protein